MPHSEPQHKLLHKCSVGIHVIEPQPFHYVYVFASFIVRQRAYFGGDFIFLHCGKISIRTDASNELHIACEMKSENLPIHFTLIDCL